MPLNQHSFIDLSHQNSDMERLNLPIKTGVGLPNIFGKNGYEEIVTVVAIAMGALRTKALIKRKDSAPIIQRVDYDERDSIEYAISTKIAKMEAKWDRLNTKIAELSNFNNRVMTLEDGLRRINYQLSEINTKMNGNMFDIHNHLAKEVWSFNNKFLEFKNELNGKLSDTNKKLEKINKVSSTFELKIKKIGHLELMQNLDNAGLRIAINPKTLEEIHQEAQSRIYGRAIPTPLDTDSNIWIVTAESLPEKSGGLAEVPTEIAQNFRKLGIKAQTILPLYETVGVSRLTETNDGYEYVYGLNKPNPSRFSLTKVVELEIPAYKDGKYKNQKVEILFKDATADEPDAIEKIYIKNSDYFRASHMYKSTVTADEPERFAFFAKAVYEFMKFAADEKSQTCLRGFNPDAFSRILPADGVILNDWHGASVAALLRYKAPLEGDFSELDSVVANKMKNMTVLNIIHNADYKGLSYENSSNMLNTLFDKYAADIYENAFTGWSMHGLWNVLSIGDNESACLSNIGACLSDLVVPVSETYAKELATQPDRSGWMQHVFAQRYHHGTMKGILNGWDLHSKQVNSSTVMSLNNLLNADKIQICTKRLRDAFGSLDFVEKKEAFKILNDKDKDLHLKIEILSKLKHKHIKSVIKSLKKEGYTFLRGYKTYTPQDSVAHIFEAKKYNKIQTLDYFKSILAYDSQNPDSKLFGVVAPKKTDLSYINTDNVDNVPIFGMASRFVSQKGIDILAMTLQKLDKNWERDFKDMPRPLFVIGGQDYESGKIKNIMSKAKKSLGDNGNNILYVDGFAPGGIYQAGCTHYLYPSWFEPCGSQAEAMGKGCVPIATKVGGLADMIEHNKTGYLTSVGEKEVIDMARQRLYQRGIDPYWNESEFEHQKADIMSDYYFEQIKNALSDFYFNHSKYQAMVLNSMEKDFSWVVFDENGKISGSLCKYLQEFGISPN